VGGKEREVVLEKQKDAAWWSSQVSRDERSALLEDERGLEQSQDYAGCCSSIVSS